MDFRTVDQMVADVITDMSMATGLGTQRYSEDIVALGIIDAYTFLSREQFWDEQTRWYSRTLDGTTGVITVGMPSTVKTFADIERVVPGTHIKPLRKLPVEFNPYAINGTSPRYVESYDDSVAQDRLFRVWPLTSTGDVRIRARSITPRASIGGDTTLNFDEYALRMYACWKQSETDAASPGQAAMFQGMFERKMRQLRRDDTTHALELDPRYPEANDEWEES